MSGWGTAWQLASGAEVTADAGRGLDGLVPREAFGVRARLPPLFGRRDGDELAAGS